MDERVTLYTDPFHPLSSTVTASPDGVPIQKLDIIKKGIVSNLYNTRYWASKKNVPSIPFYNNVIMLGADASIDDMVRSIKEGILVTVSGMYG